MPQRSKEEIEEELTRSVEVRLPRTIKNENEVRELFEGEFTVKLHRQSCRNCRVIFSSFDEKMKNIKASKDKLVDGKNIIVKPMKMSGTVSEKKVKPKKIRKKIVIPKIMPEIKSTNILHISRIKCGTKPQQIKEALIGCKSIALLKAKNNYRTAIVKMENPRIATEYLKKTIKWPIINGSQIIINADKRHQHKNKKVEKNSQLEIKEESCAEKSDAEEETDDENSQLEVESINSDHTSDHVETDSNNESDAADEDDENAGESDSEDDTE